MPNVNIKIKKEVFNDAFLPYIDTQYRYEVYYGGAGSGKSVFIAQSYVYRILTHKMLNLMVIRQTADTNRDSTFALFKQTINKWNLDKQFTIRESDMRITCNLNGNSIIFKGLDDSEKLKSITFSKGELTDIWIEEASEVAESDFNQLDVRLRGAGTKKQIRISFNPIDINHWLKKFIDNMQDNKMSLHTTYKDNKFLDDDYKKLLESYKITDPYYYTVYCLGGWGVLGQTIFNAQKVSERLVTIQDIKPFKQGYFTYEYKFDKARNEMQIDDSTIQWVNAEDGYIRIYEDVKQGYPYVIGGDTAGEGSDFFIGQCIDNTSGKQVATLRNQFDEDLYSQQVYCLGMYYNKALIGLETNYSTHPTKELQRLNYPNLYMREVEDSITHKLEKRYGFQTNKLTRPIMIADLVTIVRESTILFNDKDTLSEMLTFVRNEKGKPCAMNGCHDDCIMAMAITYYIRDQQSYTVMEVPKVIRKKWIEQFKPKKKVRM